jgi:hypothetical protein
LLTQTFDIPFRRHIKITTPRTKATSCHRCLTVSATWNTADCSQKVVGLYRADSEAQLDGLLVALPLSGWMHIRCQR